MVVVEHTLHLLHEPLRLADGCICCGDEEVQPRVHSCADVELGGRLGAGHRSTRRSRPVSRQAVDVLLLPCHEHLADGQHSSRGQSPPREHRVDEGTSDPSIAVCEGVQRFELCVSQSRLDETARGCPVDERHEILKRLWQDFRPRRNEFSLTRVDGRSAQPVLALTQSQLTEAGQQLPLQLFEIAPRHCFSTAESVDSRHDCSDVACHFGRLVPEAAESVLRAEFGEHHVLHRGTDSLDA